MAWWDDLWLNEGFASWMGTKSTAFFNPQWEVWLRKNVPRNPTRRSGIAKEQAMEGDVRKTTHPIQQPVATEADANTAFDDITYRKGQSFIRMLESYLGEDSFRKGIRLYISKHKYSNATTADLWSGLAEASGKPVEEIAAAWVHQPGFPVVSVSREGDNVHLRQERLTMNFKESAASIWPIPLTYLVSGRKETGTTLMKEAEMTLSDIPASAALKVNADGAGNYRVQYDQKSWDLLLASLANLSVPDRVNLLSDQWALVQAGRAPLLSYFDLIKKLPTATELAERDQIISAFDLMNGLLENDPVQERFQQIAREILRPTFDALGWESKPGEPARWIDLRASVIGALGDLGDPEIKKGCQERFRAMADTGKRLSPDMRRPILMVVGRYADEATWNKLHQLGLATTNIGEKQDYYEALARTTDPDLIKRTLQIALTNELPTSRATSLISHVERYCDRPELAWDFAKENMPALMAKQDALGAQSYVPSLFYFFSDPEHVQALQDYSKANREMVNEKEVAKGVDEIEVRAALKSRLLIELASLQNSATPH
jgi:aminopeptidase N